jgi:type 1 fimbria pilin
MSFKNKLSLAALCVAAMASGSAAAATEVGKGTLSVSGTIGTATCTVSASKSALTIPQFTPAQLHAATVNSELNKQELTLNFQNCSAVGDTLSMFTLRGTEPPANTSGTNYSGGFTYSGGTSTDSTKAPLYYKVKGPNGLLPLTAGITGSSQSLDISQVTDKDSFSLPVEFLVHKAPASGVHPSQFAGSYAGSVAWTIEYP